MTTTDIFRARAESLGRWHRFETPCILGIDELYLNKCYRCILINIEEKDAPEKVRKGLRKEDPQGRSEILLKRAHEVSDRELLIMKNWCIPATVGRLRAQGTLLQRRAHAAS